MAVLRRSGKAQQAAVFMADNVVQQLQMRAYLVQAQVCCNFALFIFLTHDDMVTMMLAAAKDTCLHHLR